MAPSKSLRTYGRGNNSGIRSVEAMNILFAKNMTERKLQSKIRKGPGKIQIKELPKKFKSVLSDESSLHVNINDTFDKLLKGPLTNIRPTNDLSVKIMAKNTSTSVIKHYSKMNSCSPMLSKLRSFKNRSENSEEISSFSWFKQPTLSGERITNDLEIEKIGKTNRKANNSTSKSWRQTNSRESPILLRSRAKLPDIVVTDASIHKIDIEESKITKESSKPNKKSAESSVVDPNLSYNPIFTNSVREKIVMHSSTPLVSTKMTRFVKQLISPIKTINDEISSCILKSFEEIKSWEGTFPKINPQNNKTGSLEGTEDYKGRKKQDNVGPAQVNTKRDSFVTIRDGQTNRMILDSDKNKNNGPNTKSFNLEEFELFFNKFNTGSFKLEDFERFHNSLRANSFTRGDVEKLTGRLTQSQVNRLNSISLKDFESFYSACQNKFSLSKGSFLVQSPRTINYVTNRKHRMASSKKSLNLSQKYVKLSKQFDLKDLIVVLDNILVKNSTEKMRKSRSLGQTAMMNSITQKQPVVRLTRLSLNRFEPTIKAKDRLSLNGFRACRKFSSICTPKRKTELSNVDTLPLSSEIFDLGQLFINITRMPLNVGVSSLEISEAKDDITVDKRKGRNSNRGLGNSRNADKSQENNTLDNTPLDKEDGKSRYRKSNKSRGDAKSSIASHRKDHSFPIPDKKPLFSKGKAGKSNVTEANRKSQSLDNEEVSSDNEPTRIQLSIFSDSLETPFNKKPSGEKEYVAKILAGSVSDSEIELNNTNNSFLREMSTKLRGCSQENIRGCSTNASGMFNSSTKTKSSRVLRSRSNPLRNSCHTPGKTEKYLHKPSPKDLTQEVNSRLLEAHQSDYTAQDLSNSILVNQPEEVALSASPKLRNIVINLTLHQSWDECQEKSDNLPVTRKSRSLRREGGNEENNSTSNKTRDKSSKNLSPTVANFDVSVSKTPKNTTGLSARKSLRFDQQNSTTLTRNDASDDDLVESSITSPYGGGFKAPMSFKKRQQKILNLKAGKSWRRSLLVHKRESVIDLTPDSDNVSTYSTRSARQHSVEPRNLTVNRQSIRIVPLCDPRLSRRKTALQTYAHINLSTVLDESAVDITGETPTKTQLPLEKSLPLITAKDLVLKRCGQTKPQPFEKLYTKSLLKDCKKIGEGVYGEVFLYTNPNGDTTVMKVIPIEGDKIVNQERQKKFDEILSEIVIASELSKLRKCTINRTNAFSEVQRICCVQGKYPKTLLDLWEAFDTSKGSENDNPEIFEDDQLYIVLDLANGGRDLEAFIFQNALQAVSMFKQVACALAVAEQQLQFEHRDLHWGNVLLKSVDKNKKVTWKHKGKIIESQTQGVEVTIIDFTLSRIIHDGVVIFNDLGQDPDLFIAEGDYQFEIYRLMKEKNSNDWQAFEPHTNVLWLHYIVKKSITALRYKNTKTKLHKKNIDCLKEYEKVILNFKSASEFVSQYY